MNRPKPIILCVDDERFNLAILRDMLVPRGYDVLEAMDGPSALHLLAGGPVDVVLLDINMPGIDGFEVCRRIKGNESTRQIPVVIITALTSKEDRIRGIEAGAEDFISKPFDQGEVLARIKMLLHVGELNRKLVRAYQNIKSLTAFGENLIKTFHPAGFDLVSLLDGIVSRMIRRVEEGGAGPAIVILSLQENRENCVLFLYRWSGEKLERKPLLLEMRDVIPFPADPESSRISWFNEGEIPRSPFASFVQRLASTGLFVSNLLAYTSPRLCLFALNYPEAVTEYDAAVLESIVMQTLFFRSLAAQVMETADAFSYTVYALARASEANDEETGNHILRVGECCAMMAERLGAPKRFIRGIRIQATLHDIGKIHTPPQILRKPGKLDTSEWEEMKKHTFHGARIIGDHPRFVMGRNIALSHHERWDGTGYPRGISGEQIPLEGRIIAIADGYDALRMKRVYKPAFDHDTTCRIILEGDGRMMPYHFDPAVLSSFRELSPRFQEVYELLKG